MPLTEDRTIDVICQHTKDGSIIPIKIKLQDDDGEYQMYKICAYKPLVENGTHMLPSGVPVGNHIWSYQCRIMVFGREKLINLFYNSSSGKWTCRVV